MRFQDIDLNTFTLFPPTPVAIPLTTAGNLTADSSWRKRTKTMVAINHDTCRRTARHRQYQQRLDSAYATQMRAMLRLQSRNRNGKPSPDRPASGGCQGIAAGQFRSRHSGMDQFVLTHRVGAEGMGLSSSRYGEGVAFYG